MISPLRVLLLLSGLGMPCHAFALEVGEPIPSLGGLRDLRGQVVYVDFWASWCVPCRTSMPVLDSLYRKHRERGFVVVGVNKDVSEADAARFLTRVPVTFPLLTDGGDQFARAFKVKAMPSGYLVDRKGVVRRVHRGFTTETAAGLETEIAGLLEEPK
jgi:cytochrome c biogenesis protein CcmG, thiol:disulfide interchange protein DsbE